MFERDKLKNFRTDFHQLTERFIRKVKVMSLINVKYNDDYDGVLQIMPF